MNQRYGIIPIRRLRCPMCGKPPTQLIEIGSQSMTFDVSKDGTHRSAEGICQEGNIDRLLAKCSCGRRWRIRSAVQVTCVDTGEEREESVRPHLDAGKWRCAKCDRRWKPRRIAKQSLPPGPGCGERDDVFPADDGVWEIVAQKRREREDRKRMHELARLADDGVADDR